MTTKNFHPHRYLLMKYKNWFLKKNRKRWNYNFILDNYLSWIFCFCFCINKTNRKSDSCRRCSDWSKRIANNTIELWTLDKWNFESSLWDRTWASTFLNDSTDVRIVRLGWTANVRWASTDCRSEIDLQIEPQVLARSFDCYPQPGSLDWTLCMWTYWPSD